MVVKMFVNILFYIVDIWVIIVEVYKWCSGWGVFKCIWEDFSFL